jgi:hypothetical protein
MERSMWRRAWQKWTIDKPAAFGDWLWDVFVVEFAAFLDRLTLRKVIAFIPVVILGLAYAHSIPLPPELLLVGDMLAYIDIFSIVLLVSVMSRVATILFTMKQAAASAARLATRLLTAIKRLDVRHCREASSTRRNRITSKKRAGDDEASIAGIAWA